MLMGQVIAVVWLDLYDVAITIFQTESRTFSSQQSRRLECQYFLWLTVKNVCEQFRGMLQNYVFY